MNRSREFLDMVKANCSCRWDFAPGSVGEIIPCGMHKEDGLTSDRFEDQAAFVAELRDLVDLFDVDALGDADVDALAAVWSDLGDVIRACQVVHGILEQRIARIMDGRQVVVDGLGTLVRHRKRERVSWDRDALYRVVLDSRKVDPATGEVADETPIDRLLAVFPLGNPRTTVLKERGIDPDEYRTSEWGGYQLQVHS